MLSKLISGTAAVRLAGCSCFRWIVCMARGQRRLSSDRSQMHEWERPAVLAVLCNNARYLLFGAELAACCLKTFDAKSICTRRNAGVCLRARRTTNARREVCGCKLRPDDGAGRRVPELTGQQS
jgi:hypothetical protein